jgi:hypothetical protein
MPRLYRNPFVLPSLIASIAISACGDSSGPSEPDAHFSARISGEVGREFGGDANFAPALASNGIGSAFLFAERDGSGRPVNIVSFHRWSTEPVARGDYQVASEPSDEEFQGRLMLDATGIAGGLSCVATDGVLRVSDVSAQRVYGTFELVASCYRSGSDLPIPVEAEGAFNASRGSFDHPGVDRATP